MATKAAVNATPKTAQRKSRTVLAPRGASNTDAVTTIVPPAAPSSTDLDVLK